MVWRLISRVLLAGCIIVLAGCPNAVVEPSIRYVSLDAPAGMSQAVVVEGYPLAHTRQLLPLDNAGNLVGEGSVHEQIEQVLDNLQTVLETAGSGLDKLVRLHVCADSPETIDRVREQLGKRLDEGVRPAISAVVSPLANPKALVAVDAVAIAGDLGGGVMLAQCAAAGGDKDCADVAVLPVGGVVYLSGHADKSPLAEATVKSVTALLEVVDQLELDRSDVVRMKVFVDSASAAEEALAQIEKLFPGQLVPPVVFVEWIASAPVEIEMIVRLPLSQEEPDESLSFYLPPDAKPSPTFSRVALVDTPRQIYISGLSALAPGDGAAQVRDVFEQLQQILDATGSDLLHLAKATYYVCDEDASAALNKLRPEFYDPERPPAASKATVHGVGQADRTLTMDMIAVGGGKS